MSYQALYREWRPQVFEDVIGQDHITKTIKNQIASARTAHAYLFCGTRGTGKTSTAKIFSRAVNCLDIKQGNPCNVCETCRGIISGGIMDVVEIDAASNNGVDNVREIRDEVAYSPSQARYKVYIIDEVHMLSTGAFNALLKTLEEPPPHVIFILATTESHKIPATILSRCQRFDFKRITVDDIVIRLKKVTQKAKIDVEDKALRMVAGVSDGSMRDALSILDQCMASGKEAITYEDIINTLGASDHQLLLDMGKYIAEKKTDEAVGLIDRLIMEGKDIIRFMGDLIGHFRNLLLCKMMDNTEGILDISNEALTQLKQQSTAFSQEKLIACIQQLSDAHSTVKWSVDPRIVLEVSIIKLCRQNLDISVEALLDRISELEQKLANGIKFALPVEDKAQSDNHKNNKAKKDEQQKKVPVPEPKIKKVYPDDVALKKASQLWAEILTEIKNARKLALFGHLSDIKVQPIEDKLGLVFKDSCATNMLVVSRSENIEIIEDVIKKVCGSEIKVKCFLEKELDKDKKHHKKDPLDKLIEFGTELGDIMQVIDE